MSSERFLQPVSLMTLNKIRNTNYTNNPLGNLNSGGSPAELIGSDVEMSRCFRWRCSPVFGIIITNFTLSNNAFNLFTIYLSILQCTNYNHIAIVFPPLPILDTHNRLFRRPSAAYNSVNPGSFSKWGPAKDVKYRRRTRVQMSASKAFAKKFRYAFS